jgi:mannan endo-1,4-beta-mannosidase
MRFILFLLTYISQFLLFGCANSEPLSENTTAPLLLTSSIINGAQDVSYGLQAISLTFDQNIILADKDAVLLNGEKLANVEAAFKELKINVQLLQSTEYVLQILNTAVKGPTGIFGEATSISFKTISELRQNIKTDLVATNPSTQAEKVYSFLRENFGKKSISATMANVSWNINEAEWIYKHTGKYPALNGFDLIHLYASPATWINYNDTKLIEDWWNANGLVTLMWHWNVPAIEGSSNHHFYTKDTQFDISKAVIDETYEHKIVKADLEKAAKVLLLLKEKNIPVLWRPLHEAAGKWFWWGANDANSYKKLWIMMFNYFKSKELNNLIWVWTSETNDDDWYPGDDYVDIIGCDLYNRPTSSSVLTTYNYIKTKYPDKIITLSEFGTLTDFKPQWDSGVTWSWIMPWYDYDRTVDIQSNSFNEKSHIHANIDYWNELLTNENILTRDQMPNLK